MIIINIGNSIFIEENVIWHAYQTWQKNNPFYTSSEKCFLKDVNRDNHWVGHSVMKPVDDEFFQRRRDIKEGVDDKKGLTLIWRL